MYNVNLVYGRVLHNSLQAQWIKRPASCRDSRIFALSLVTCWLFYISNPFRELKFTMYFISIERSLK